MPSSAGKTQPRHTWGSLLLCGLYAFGVVCSLLVYGLLQEKIMSRPYHSGTDLSEYLSAFSADAVPQSDSNVWPTADDYFSSSLFLVLITRVVGFVFALVMMIANKEPYGLQAGFFQYLLVSATTVAASKCQFDALIYVCFTLQILGKSFKMFPIMCWDFMILGKSNRRVLDWIVGLFFTIGVICYVASGHISPARSSSGVWWGLLLMVGFFAFDALTVTIQERAFADGASAKYNQMLYINLFSALLASAMLFFQHDWSLTIAFCTSHPLVLMDASIMSVSSLSANWFVFALVHGFGSLVFTGTMNVRQILSIVASIIAYHHNVTALQIVALSVCCWALLWQVLGDVWRKPSGEQTPLMNEANSLEDGSAKKKLKA